MAIHWRVQFKSISDVSYSVNIYDDNYTDTPVELTGAANPFETEENTDTDILAPIRTSTGYISVINEDNLDGIIPLTPKARFVTLTRGATVLWQGYISQEQFTMPWTSTPYQISFPVISAMSILKGKQIQMGEIGARARVADYLYEAINQCGADYDTIILPWDIAESAEDDSDAWLRIGLQERNWFTYKNENVIDKTESRYDGVSWLDMLSSILQAFGYTLYEQGTTLLIAGRNVVSYHQISTSELLDFANNEHGTSTAVSVSSIAFPTIGGNDGTVDILLSARRGIVEGAINKFDDDSTPAIGTQYLDYVGMVQVDREFSVGPGYYFSEKLAVYEPLTGTSIWSFRQFANGVEETWNSADLQRDYHMGAFCRTMDGADCILINYNNLSGASGYGGTYTVSVKSPTQSLLAGGSIRIKGKIAIYEGEGGTVEHQGVFALRVGNKYYNASTNDWQTTAVTFNTFLKDSSGEIGSLSTNNSGDDTGYYCPLPTDGIFGDVELYFYDPVSTSPLAVGVQASYLFTEMEISFVGPPADKFRDDPVTDTNRFVNTLNEFNAEDNEHQLVVTSYINERMGYGVLLKPDFSAPLGKIYWEGNREEVYFEETLLDTVTEYFSRPQRLVTIPVKSLANYSPIDYYLEGGNQYLYLCASKKWRDELQRIKIIKRI